MKLILTVYLLATILVYTQSEVDKEKKEIISHFIIGDAFDFASESLFERQIQSTISSHPELSDSVWESVRVNVDGKDLFKNAVIDLYANKLTIDELRVIKKVLGNPEMIIMEVIDNNPEMIKMKNVEKEVLESIPTTETKVGSEIIKNINAYISK